MREKFSKFFSRVRGKLDVGVRFGARVRGGRLQVPTVTYEHSVTGHQVRLVGVMHVAEEDFYDLINEYLDTRPRDVVLYEKVMTSSDDDIDALSGAARGNVAWMRQLKRMYSRFARMLDCMEQRLALPIRDGWINTDMTEAELAKALVAVDVVLDVEDLDLDRIDVDNDALRWLANAAMRFVPLMDFVPKRGEKARLESVVIGQRNVLAARAILQRQEDGPIIAIWGARHVPGIGALLRTAGYEEVETVWRTAYRLRNYDLLEALNQRRME